MRLGRFLVFEPNAHHMFAGQRSFVGHINAHHAAAIRLTSDIHGGDAECETRHPALRHQLARRVFGPLGRHPQARNMLHFLESLELLHTDRQGSNSQQVVQFTGKLFQFRCTDFVVIARHSPPSAGLLFTEIYRADFDTALTGIKYRLRAALFYDRQRWIARSAKLTSKSAL